MDDEVPTGNTAAALAEEFRHWRCGAAPVAVTLAVLLSWRDQGAAMPQGLVGIESLAAGGFEFQARGDFAPAPAAQHTLDSRVQVRRGVRHGSIREEVLPAHWNLAVQAGERVLIIGQGEHGFLPLRLAESLEERGASAWVLASTRSPILLGGAIRHLRCFPALSGEGHDEHLYNVPEDHDYDRVLLCMEDARPAEDHPIWSVPRLEVLV